MKVHIYGKKIQIFLGRNFIDNFGYMGFFDGTSTLSTIESIDTGCLDPSLIHEIYKIEQDLWARYLGEYVKCTDCGHVHSKEDIFGGLDLLSLAVDIRKNTVFEIQQALESGSPPCHQCGGETEEIFGIDYQDEIRTRHDFEKSFLIIHRSINGRILGYVDAYISDFDTIYERELACYYSKVGKQEILRRVENILGNELPKKLICLSGVGSTPDFATMRNLYNLEKAMVEEVSEYNPYFTGIYESVIGSYAHAILDICKARRLKTRKEDHQGCNQDFYSDIFVHKNMPFEGVKGLGRSFKDFYKTHHKRIRELRN